MDFISDPMYRLFEDLDLEQFSPEKGGFWRETMEALLLSQDSYRHHQDVVSVIGKVKTAIDKRSDEDIKKTRLEIENKIKSTDKESDLFTLLCCLSLYSLSRSALNEDLHINMFTFLDNFVDLNEYDPDSAFKVFSMRIMIR